jgi:iron only hydrogenase large subunit-like protein
MMEIPLFDIQSDKCIACYACVRACPVSAIQVKPNEEIPNILHNRCIGCGDCFSICTPNAIVYRDNCEHTKLLFESGKVVVAIVAPSISGEFSDITDYRKFVRMIKQLGFHYVNEVSFGADLVAYEYKELFENFKGKYYLSGNCPAVVSYIEKFKPDLVDNLAPIVTPMVATANVVRQKYGNDCHIVYIGPCIASKEEALRYPDVIDDVLTFQELRKLFAEFNIKESTVEYSDFEAPIGYKGSLFPISNGILQAADIDENLLTGSVITTEGSDNMLQGVEQFAKHTEFIHKHFNMYYCEGCLMGPGTSMNSREKYLRTTLVTDYANKRLKTFDHKQWDAERLEYGLIDLNRIYRADDQRIPEPPLEQVEEVLKVIDREDADQHHGCEACGYKSCRDLAVAVAKGLAKPEMCMTYNLKSKQEYIKSLRFANEKLSKAQVALLESEKNALTERNAMKDAFDRISDFVQKMPTGVVIVDEKMKILTSNESFINLLGNEAKEINDIIPGLVGADLKTLVPPAFVNLMGYVINNDDDVHGKDIPYGEGVLNVYIFSLRKNKVAGAIVRDMLSPEVLMEEVIKRVTEAIDENLQMVQQIGFLLGEGASKTERMLNSIIEYHKSGQGKK